MFARTQLWQASIAGAFADVVMAGVMMVYMAVQGHSVWTNPDLIAVMWLGLQAADGLFGWAAMIGLATHMGASVLIGMMGLPFIAGLLPRRVMLAAATYALTSYRVAIAFVMIRANPLFVERTHVVPMTVAHAVFGLAYGAAFLALTRGHPGSASGFPVGARRDRASAAHGAPH